MPEKIKQKVRHLHHHGDLYESSSGTEGKQDMRETQAMTREEQEVTGCQVI